VTMSYPDPAEAGSAKTSVDEELTALQAMVDAMNGLDEDARGRALWYLQDRFGGEHRDE
jgi:hypothetical protein